jgi:hypothetical protein
MREATAVSHIQHTAHGQCCCCAAARTVEPPEPEPFRFTDIPLGQWVVGGIMTLVVVIGLAVKFT